MKLDMTSSIEERIRQINQIDSIAVLNALLQQTPASDDEAVIREWKTTKALIRGRIAQIQESVPSFGAQLDKSDISEAAAIRKRKKKTVAHILSVISFIFTSAYFLLLAFAISGGIGEAASLANTAYGGAFAAGVAISIGLMAPHIVVTFVGYAFNIVSMFVRRPWPCLVSAILYAVSAVLLISWSIGMIIQIILMFVAFGLRVSANK